MWNSPNAQVENCTNNSRSLGLYFTEKGGGQMSGNNQFPMESKTWKIHYQNWKKGLGLISQLGDSLLSALGADEFIRDIGPSDPGTREVNPCQAVTAFNHWPASKGFTTVTRHSIVTIVNVTIIYVTKKLICAFQKLYTTCTYQSHCLKTLFSLHHCWMREFLTWCFQNQCSQLGYLL